MVVSIFVTGALTSYSDRQLGMLGRTRELVTLWQSKRQNIPDQARHMLAGMESSQSEMERALGAKLQDKDVLIIGPGQQLVEMSFFARRNRVTGIDLDVIPQHPSVREYLTMFRNNGSIRTLKTVGRKAMGYDRALRRELERQGLAMDDNPTIVAMDAAAMTFPDDSFDSVFSQSCFEHLSAPGDVIRHVARVLRPGGLAYVDVHLYTSDSGCHDVRIFSGRRESIPPWSHLRPRYRHLVQSNSYLNEIRLAQWRDLFSRHWPGVTFRLRPEDDPAIRGALAHLRAQGELGQYEDEELLSVYLIAEWVKPTMAVDGETPRTSTGLACHEFVHPVTGSLAVTGSDGGGGGPGGGMQQPGYGAIPGSAAQRPVEVGRRDQLCSAVHDHPLVCRHPGRGRL
jgi:SAM-dependent methyltransferase